MKVHYKTDENIDIKNDETPPDSDVSDGDNLPANKNYDEKKERKKKKAKQNKFKKKFTKEIARTTKNETI